MVDGGNEDVLESRLDAAALAAAAVGGFEDSCSGATRMLVTAAASIAHAGGEAAFLSDGRAIAERLSATMAELATASLLRDGDARS